MKKQNAILAAVGVIIVVVVLVWVRHSPYPSESAPVGGNNNTIDQVKDTSDYVPVVNKTPAPKPVASKTPVKTTTTVLNRASLITGTIVPLPEQYESASSTEIIFVGNPGYHSSMSSPYQITGVARGYWYSEGSFPIYLLNSNGVVIGQAIARAQSNWNTLEMVPFVTSISFPKQGYNSTGTLVLKRANPSGAAVNNMTAVLNVGFQ